MNTIEKNTIDNENDLIQAIFQLNQIDNKYNCLDKHILILTERYKYFANSLQWTKSDYDFDFNNSSIVEKLEFFESNKEENLTCLNHLNELIEEIKEKYNKLVELKEHYYYLDDIIKNFVAESNDSIKGKYNYYTNLLGENNA